MERCGRISTAGCAVERSVADVEQIARTMGRGTEIAMFIIRADGNAKIGAGHLMRCFAIAEALREAVSQDKDLSCGQDTGILFVCADSESAKLAGEHGFDVRVLHTDYRQMEQELPEWEKLRQDGGMWEAVNRAVKNKDTNVILIDSYFVTDFYLERLKSCMSGYRVLLMDDMQKCAYPVDGVINYNLFADAKVYEELYRGRDTKCYLGGRYVPIRKQFLRRPYRVAEEVRNVLITTGGGDVDNIAGKILDYLLEKCGKLNYDLIIGRFHPGLAEMRRRAEGCSRIRLHYDVQDMAALMAGCDLAVTAGGSTIYELAAVGVPFLCFSYAENQELMTEYIGSREIAGFAGAYHKNPEATLAALAALVTEYCGSAAKRNECYLKTRQLIDGQGAMRLACEALLGRPTA